MLKGIVVGIVVGLVVAGTVGVIAYKTTVDVNESSISTLQKSFDKFSLENNQKIEKLGAINEATRNTLTELRLTVARAHPQLSSRTSGSIEKLNRLSDSELKELSAQLPVFVLDDTPDAKNLEIFHALKTKYQINKKDIAIYYETAGLPSGSEPEIFK